MIAQPTPIVTTTGQQVSANSISVVPASDAVITVAGSAVVGAAPTNPPLSVSGVDQAGNKQHLQMVTATKELMVSDAKLPASLGAKTAANSLSVTRATDDQVGFTANPSASFTRPADTVAYAVGDMVSASTSATAALQLTAMRMSAGSGIVRRLRLYKSGVVLTSAQFRVHLFSAAPTALANDNAAFAATGVANYLGQADITMTQALADGAWGCTDLTFTDLAIKLGAGQIVYALLEARAAYTPASSETITLVAELLQD